MFTYTKYSPVVFVPYNDNFLKKEPSSVVPNDHNKYKPHLNQHKKLSVVVNSQKTSRDFVHQFLFLRKCVNLGDAPREKHHIPPVLCNNTDCNCDDHAIISTSACNDKMCGCIMHWSSYFCSKLCPHLQFKNYIFCRASGRISNQTLHTCHEGCNYIVERQGSMICSVSGRIVSDGKLNEINIKFQADPFLMSDLKERSKVALHKKTRKRAAEEYNNRLNTGRLENSKMKSSKLINHAFDCIKYVCNQSNPPSVSLSNDIAHAACHYFVCIQQHIEDTNKILTQSHHKSVDSYNCTNRDSLLSYNFSTHVFAFIAECISNPTPTIGFNGKPTKKLFPHYPDISKYFCSIDAWGTEISRRTNIDMVNATITRAIANLKTWVITMKPIEWIENQPNPTFFLPPHAINNWAIRFSFVVDF